MNLIHAKHLVKQYNDRKVVNDLSLAINEGEIVAIIGTNGAGKSTTLDLITGIKAPTSGKVEYWDEAYKQQMGIQLQTTPFFPGMTVVENIQIFAAFYNLKLERKRIEELLQEFSLQEVAKTDAIKLSGGQQKRLSIALSLLHDPKIIFLDEPTSALDPIARIEVKMMLQRLIEKGKSIVLTSHDMEEVSKLANRIVFIQAGVIKADGTPAELLAKYNVENLEELYFILSSEGELS